MKTLKQDYEELVSLTQLFLFREYSLKATKTVDPTLLAFFQKKIGTFTPLNVAKKGVPAVFTSPSSSQPLKMPMAGTPTILPSPDPRPPEPRPEPPAPTPLPPPTQPEPPPTEPKPPIIQDKTSKTKGWNLEPLKDSATPQDFREFWKLFPQLFPALAVCETIPTDDFAQKRKNSWVSDQVISPIIILSFQEGEKQLTFLKNMAQAISLRLAPTRVLEASKLEKESGWENVLKSSALRLVIASDYALYLQPKLLSFYREMPQQGKHYLNHIPLLLLSDLALYLKEPQLKSLLWRAICNEFAASQHQFSVR